MRTGVAKIVQNLLLYLAIANVLMVALSAGLPRTNHEVSIMKLTHVQLLFISSLQLLYKSVSLISYIMLLILGFTENRLRTRDVRAADKIREALLQTIRLAVMSVCCVHKFYHDTSSIKPAVITYFVIYQISCSGHVPNVLYVRSVQLCKLFCVGPM